MASTPVPQCKAEFLKVCLDASILRFGQYTLKSGRTSPYFFKVGDFNTAALTGALCTAYAQAIIHGSTSSSGSAPLTGPAVPAFDVLFGPAYKGCGLAYGVTMKLSELDAGRYGGVGFCHDRKEAKDHGEGGSTVGMALAGRRVLIVDDVISAGTAKRDAIHLIRRHGGTPVGIVIALDRMEKLPSGPGGSDQDRNGDRGSAVGQLVKEFGIPVASVLTLDDLVAGMRDKGLLEQSRACEEYRTVYGATD